MSPDNHPSWHGLPRTVWVLGLVSMLMDLSSEMIHGLLPVFLVVALGAPRSLVGLIVGVGEATASIVKLFSGWLSDRFGRRKPLAVSATASPRRPSRSSRSPPRRSGSSSRASSTASARASAARRAMPSSPT